VISSETTVTCCRLYNYNV